ncbi:E3 Ubiquitin-Protein Ligase Rnf26 [Manis pentadactyla]|nr:E3 Ubiquitin-Protein Ligase Rnf26 [Manis pentadactyla]
MFPTKQPPKKMFLTITPPKSPPSLIIQTPWHRAERGSWPEKGQRPGTPKVDRPPLDSRSRSSLTLTIRPLREVKNRSWASFL